MSSKDSQEDMSLRIVKEIELMSSEATKILVKSFQQSLDVCLSTPVNDCSSCSSLIPGLNSIREGQIKHNKSLS